MKKVLFAALLMITSIAAFSQQAPKAPFRHEGKVEMRGNFQHKPQFRNHQFPFYPKPLSVTVKGDRVILIFNKEDYNKLRPMVRERVMWKERPRTRPQQLLIDKFTK
jgi:hypothetical protein